MADVWVLSHACGWSRLVDISTTPEERERLLAEHALSHPGTPPEGADS